MIRRVRAVQAHTGHVSKAGHVIGPATRVIADCQMCSSCSQFRHQNCPPYGTQTWGVCCPPPAGAHKKCVACSPTATCPTRTLSAFFPLLPPFFAALSQPIRFLLPCSSFSCLLPSANASQASHHLLSATVSRSATASFLASLCRFRDDQSTSVAPHNRTPQLPSVWCLLASFLSPSLGYPPWTTLDSVPQYYTVTDQPLALFHCSLRQAGSNISSQHFLFSPTQHPTLF